MIHNPLKNRVDAILVVYERFIAQCEYNARELRGTLWSEEREKRFLDFMEKNNRRLSEMKSKTQR